jgi:hypothetical protein
VRTRLGVLAACVVVGLLTAWYAGAQIAPSAPGPAPGTVRLGPDAGEPVTDYLARLPATLPAPGSAAYALVQFRTELTGADALAAVSGAVPTTAVFRVPLDRVQTALRFEPLGSSGSLDLPRDRARLAASADAGRLTGRARDVAAAEAAALADPSCACVVALVVRGDRATLDGLAANPQVRAVHAAPADAQPVELALAPLLPAQQDAATPLPDDGPVPPA